MSQRAAARYLVAFLNLSPACLAGAAVAEGGARQDWTLEHFGNDVTVLRWRSDEQDRAEILLSCEGRDRRLRLRIPEKVAERLRTAKRGRVLIRAVEGRRPDGAFVAARYRMAGERVLTVSEIDHDGRGAVLAIGRILTMQPGSLDVLIHPDHDFVTLDRVIGYRLALPAPRQEPQTFRNFVDSCSRRGSNDTNGKNDVRLDLR